MMFRLFPPNCCRPEQYVPAEEYKHFNEAPFTSCRVPKSFVSPADLLPELAAAKAVPVDTVSQRLMSCEGGSSLPFGYFVVFMESNLV